MSREGSDLSRTASPEPSAESRSAREVFDAWELADAESDVAWLLRPSTDGIDIAKPATTAPRRDNAELRIDLPFDGEVRASSRFRFSALLAWSLITCGMTAFTCGALLAGWSVLEDRQELWNWGLPIAMAGQVALIAGIVIQVDLNGTKPAAGKTKHRRTESGGRKSEKRKPHRT